MVAESSDCCGWWYAAHDALLFTRFETPDDRSATTVVLRALAPRHEVGRLALKAHPSEYEIGTTMWLSRCVRWTLRVVDLFVSASVAPSECVNEIPLLPHSARLTQSRTQKPREASGR